MIPAFITEAERFATLEGNVGRKVTRHLEQLFKSGQFARVFECTEAFDIVDKALFALRMQKCQEYLTEYAKGENFSVSTQGDATGQVRIVVTPLVAPVTLREKQNQLATFGYIMRRFVAYLDPNFNNTREQLEKFRNDYFEGKSFTATDVQYTYLTELVSGNYTNVERTSSYVLNLAIALNPVVDDVLRSSFAKDREAA